LASSFADLVWIHFLYKKKFTFTTSL